MTSPTLPPPNPVRVDAARTPLVIAADALAVGDILVGTFLHGTGQLWTLPVPRDIVDRYTTMQFSRPAVRYSYITSDGTPQECTEAAHGLVLVLR